MTKKQERVQAYFFGFLLLGSMVLVATVFTPFFNSIALALVVAVIFKPVYIKILSHIKKWPGVASLTTILVIAVVVILPLFFISTQIIKETQNVAGYIIASDTENLIDQTVSTTETAIQNVLPNFSLGNIDDLKQKTSSAALSLVLDNWTLLKSGTITALHTIFGFILAIILLFFLFKDGGKLKKYIVEISPLKNVDDEKIINKLEGTINSVIRGALVVALLQGFFTGLGLLIFGVPNATLWGVIAAIGSLVPGLGTAIVLVPAATYLFFTTGGLMALGLVVWGIVVVGLVDNIMIPYFYSRGVKIHPILILISVLGGILTFGPLGFLYGPLILSLFFTLLEMYQPVVMDK
ncbi:MAG: AI-2E family transporter [Candidatus Paceibacterota bacterium]